MGVLDFHMFDPLDLNIPDHWFLKDIKTASGD